MSKYMLILKGFMKGVKKFSPYKNPDIIQSVVDGHVCESNDLKIKYLPEKDKYYIYHSYIGLDENMKKNYDGRWYSMNYLLNKKDLNHENNTLSVLLKSIDWEDFDTGKSTIKDVNIIITFTPIGFNKLTKFIDRSENKKNN